MMDQCTKTQFTWAIVLFIAISLPSSCIAQPSPDILEDPSPRQELPAGSNGITLSLENAAHTLPVDELELIIENSGEAPFEYGEFFYMEKHVDGEWYMLVLPDSVFDSFVDFDNFGERIESGEIETEQIAPADYDLTIDRGKYRIVKAFRSESGTGSFWLAAEFEVE